MSDLGMGRAMRWLVLAALGSMTLPAPAVAQTALETRRELDRLLPELHEATVAFEARRSRASVAGSMAIERGHLRLDVDSAIASPLAAAAATASASLDRLFGDRVQLASAYVIRARLDSVITRDRRSALIRIRRNDPDSDSPHGAAVRRAGNSERVVAVGTPEETNAALVVALDAVASVPLHASLDDDLRLWFRTALPSTAESPEETGNVYIDLATASTALSRRCLAGDVRRCRQVLGLEPIADPIVEAYTAADRYRLVEGDADRLRTPAKAAEYDRCVVGRDDAACIARLRDLSQESRASSYSTTAARRSFARWALERGGDGAYARLHASAGQSLPDRFGLAAGMPADSVIASWHAHLMSGRPEQPAIPPLTALATVMWIGVCGALALRSSRWR